MNDTAELPLEADPETKLATPALESLLRAKYPRDRYALFFDVPDAVSLDQRRRIDALSIGIWRSVGREISGFELKISRADWLRELKAVEKADPFIQLCDFFWLVTADSKIAKIEEIPACWGWMSATKDGLRVQRPATRLPGTGANIPRAFVLGILRRMQDDLITSPDVRAHIEEKVKAVTEGVDNRIKWETERLRKRAEELEETIATFEKESGIDLRNWRMRNAGAIVRQLQALGFTDDGLNAIPKLLEEQENALRRTLERVIEARQGLMSIAAGESGDANQA